MFDTAAFAEKASLIAKEKADALAKQELEELQGFTSNTASKKRGDDDEEAQDTTANAPDRDAVEKSLIHVGAQAEMKSRSQPTLEVRRFLEAMKHESVQACQLSEAELRGFISEAEIDERGEVAYVDHIRTWVPIIFELRKSRIYDGILAKEWGPGEDHLIDLSGYEAQFPLQLPRDDEERPSSAASNASRRSGRRSNTEGGRRGADRGSSSKRDLSRGSSRARSNSQSSIGSERGGHSRTSSRAPSRTG